MPFVQILLIATLSNFLIGTIVATTQAGVKLDSYKVDTSTITISGLSSGAIMAMQYHVAFSEQIRGAGILAGVPYACTRDGAYAIVPCLDFPEETDIPAILDFISQQATINNIDHPSNISGDTVFIFHGLLDHRIKPHNAVLVKDIYAHFNASIKTELTLEAAHGFPTNDYGGACDQYSPETQFINNCSYHSVFETLNHLYNQTLQYPTGSELLTPLISYDQVEFGSVAAMMDSIGYVYVPTVCGLESEDKQPCKFHVVFHGCQQYRGNIGEIYVTKTGYLEVAEKNGIVLIFPQVINSTDNPNGCWDWWGFNDENFLIKTGRQMKAVNEMVQRVAFCEDNCSMTGTRTQFSIVTIIILTLLSASVILFVC
ncbi:uncharacterized protein LOC110849958 [Folsomia candida]|uniref:uncharacterized protein LOC110849958 n=1 Tax=Folsomia candida TaxID=158441 RepID=UPI000B8FFAA9|nr:uncharacterized protein LOC110849958 [Folsomia candida]